MRRVEPAAAMQRELVERARRGDHDAFTRPVDGSVDRLYSVANLILRDADRAQDAVLEALVAAWSARMPRICGTTAAAGRARPATSRGAWACPRKS